MIGRLRGEVVRSAAEQVILDVGGVGYLVQVPASTAAELPPGREAVLWTELVVREDALQLVGYREERELAWHRLLVSVQGVGARAALAIIGAIGCDGLSRAIALGDWSAVKAAPGIGPKIAQRVVNELKGKGPAAVPAAGGAVPAVSGGAPAEAVSALVNLGYAAAEAQRAVAEAAGEGADDTSALIRVALRRLTPQ